MNWAGYVCCGVIIGAAVAYVAFVTYAAKDYL